MRAWITSGLGSALFLALALGCSGPGVGRQPARARGADARGQAELDLGAPEAAENQASLFRRYFSVAHTNAPTLLRLGADNHLELSLDGRVLADHSDWQRPGELDLAPWLVPGQKHELSVWARNYGGPGGFWAELEGPGLSLRSDASWQARLEDQSDWSPAHVLGTLGDEPWGEPESAVVCGLRLATPAEGITLAPGFEVELVYSVPRARQGSWVSLTFDARGRMLASAQDGSIWALAPDDARAGGRATRVADEVGNAQGLAWVDGALYAMVNGSRPASGLYCLRDLDHDGFFETNECLLPLEGSGEHGPHAVLLDRDGDSLWIVAGNHTSLPEKIASSRVPEVWEEDQLLPRHQDPNGHAVGITAPGGWIAQTDLDGGNFELFVVGLRNSYDMDFDPHGELYVFDSDMEWDVGLPWYRPARVLHAQSGADFGWRAGSGKWPADLPDTLPAEVDIGRASPTGVVHGRRGNFPRPWSNRLFVADWSYGVVYAVDPDGRRHEVFLQGRGLPIADLAFDPAGDLWFVTGGRGTQSGVYRVAWSGPPPGPFTVRASEPRQAGFERWHGRELADGRAVPDEVWGRVESLAARTALEHFDPSTWSRSALELPQRRRGLAALLALVRVAPQHAPAIIRRILERGWLDALPGEVDAPAALPDGFTDLRLVALRVIELACIRGPELDPELRVELREALRARYPGDSWPVERELAELLVYLDAPDAPQLFFERMQRVRTQEQALHLAWCLRVTKLGWDDELRVAFLTWLARAETRYEGGHSLARYLELLREDFLEPLDEERRAELVARAEALGPPAPEALARELPNPGPAIQAWRLEDLSGSLALVHSDRSFDTGQRVFRAASCTRCHRIGSSGGSDGPDLTTVGGRFSPRDLLQSLLDPSRDVADVWQETEIWATDGELLVGRAMPADGDWLRVQPRRAGEQPLEIHTEDVELVRLHPLSSMPEGLLDPFTPTEILDLLAYLIAGGKADDPAFSTAGHGP